VQSWLKTAVTPAAAISAPAKEPQSKALFRMRARRRLASAVLRMASS
jgi:hypothetical protein